MRLQRGDSRAFLICPVAEHLHVLGSKLCTGMQRSIGTKWHRPALHFPANLVQLPCLLSRVISSPFANVHIFAPVIHVTNDKPRPGRYVAVPGPASSVLISVAPSPIATD